MKKFFLLSISFLICAGCDLKDLTPFVGGTYNGFLIVATETSREETFVTAQLTASDSLHYSLTLSERGQSPWTMAIEVKSKKEINLSLPLYFQNSLKLMSVKNDCFESQDPANWARLCYAHGEVTLDFKGKLNSFTLVLDPDKNKNIPVPEAPQAYTKNELLNRAINQSFSSRIEFEKLTQRQLSAKNQAGGLFPRASMNTLVALVTPTFASVLKDMGDLAPFLLPNRWMRAQESKLAYEAEFNGWITMKADAANIVEGLALEVLQTEDTMEKLENNKKSITAIRDRIKLQETSSVLPLGSSAEVTAIIEDIDEALVLLEENKKNGYASLAQAAGFMNSDAISQLVPTEQENSITTPTPFDPKQVTKIALSRSYELRQIDFLYQAAEKEKNSSRFDFLDPNGNIDGGLGPGYPSYVKIGESKKRQILRIGEGIQGKISEKLTLAFDEIAAAEETRSKAINGYDTRQSIIDRYTRAMEYGLDYNLASLATALRERTEKDILITGASYQYLQGWSKLNRLMYSGPYANLSRGDMLVPAFEADINSNAGQKPRLR